MHLTLTNPFDVMVLNLILPEMDGLSFCQKLRADAKLDTPVLMLTARDTLDDKLEGVKAGADDYMVKPFALQELHARLQALYKHSHGKTDNLQCDWSIRRIKPNPVENNRCMIYFPILSLVAKLTSHYRTDYINYKRNVHRWH